MIQQYILTVEKYGELDTYGDLDVEFNFVFDDPENISERRSSFSKTIFLPNTNNNANFFKNYFGLTIEDSFDTRKKIKCDVRMGSDNVFPGFLKLKSVVNDFEDIRYEVNIISNDIALSDDIGDDSFNVLDFSEFNHIRNKTNIVNSWETSIKQNDFDVAFKYGNGYVYPDIIYGNDQDIYNRRKVYDLFPAIYDYTIIQKIMQHYGRTVVSNFFETDYFKSLIVPFSKDKLSIDDIEKANRELLVGIPSASSPIDLGIEMERDPAASQAFKNTLLNPINVFQLTDESTLDFNDPGGNFYGSYWMPSKQGRYNISFEGRLLMEYRSFNGNNFEYDSGDLQYFYRMHLLRTDGTSTIISDSGASTSNPFGMLNFGPSDNAVHASPWLDTAQQLVFNLNATDVFMNPGDRVYVQMFFKHPGDTDWNIIGTTSKKVTAKPVLLRDTGGELTFFKVELNNNIMMANEMVNMNAILPEMKIKDYLNNLIKEFNLVFVADKEDPYLLTIEPLVYYLKSRKREIDLSDRLDHDQTITKTPTTDLVARSFKYSHAEDNDYFNQNYQDETNKTYGEQIIFTNNEINNNEDNTTLSWAATPNAQRYFIDRITPWFCTIDADETLKPKSVKPRHLFYNGLKDCNTWILEDYKDDTTFYTSSKYAQCGMWDDMTNPINTLEYGPSDKTYFATNTFPGMNLFNLFHRDYLQSIVDKDAYILKANFYLNPAIIADLDYRDIIHVDGVNYRILKINNYNPIAYDKTTEVELLKIVDYETYFTEFVDVPLSHFYCPTDVQLVKDSNIYVYKSKSGQELSEMCCDSLGGEFINGVCRVRSISADPDGPIILNNISTESYDSTNGATNTIASPTITVSGNNIYTAPGATNLNLMGDNISVNGNTSNSMSIGNGISIAGTNMLVVGSNITATESNAIYTNNVITNNINGIPSSSFIATPRLIAWDAYNSNGIVVQTSSTTWVARSINGTTGQINISNNDGTLGNPSIALDNTFFNNASLWKTGSSGTNSIRTLTASNDATGDYSVVLGGTGNISSGNYSVNGGGSGNDATGDYSGISSGSGGTASGNYSYIASGANNSSLNDYSSIMGGESNIITGFRSTIFGGFSNVLSDGYSVILCGNICIGSGAYNFINGFDNSTSGTYSTILNGASNRINCVGLLNNTLLNCNSVTLTNTTNVTVIGLTTATTITESNIVYIGKEIVGGKVAVTVLNTALSNSSNSVYSNIISFNAKAGATYKLSLIGTYQSVATTTGIKVRLSGTAVANVAGYMNGAISSALNPNSLMATFSSMTSEIITSGVSVINTPQFIVGDVIIRCTTAGTVILQMASEVNTSAAQLNIGTTVYVERII